MGGFVVCSMTKTIHAIEECSTEGHLNLGEYTS